LRVDLTLADGVAVFDVVLLVPIFDFLCLFAFQDGPASWLPQPGATAFPARSPSPSTNAAAAGVPSASPTAAAAAAAAAAGAGTADEPIELD